jgi:hypothetical protein
MNNRLLAVLASSLILLAAPATAAPLAISGNATIKYEADSAANTPTEAGTMYTITLRGEQKLSPNFSVFARLGAQYATNPVLADFNQTAYVENIKAVVSIDQYGFIFKPGNWTVTLGRQEAIVGVTALLYERHAENIGANAFVEGLAVRGKIGAVDISALAARENNLWLANNSLYALRSGLDLSKNLAAGLTLASYKYYGGNASNHWALDVTATCGKNTVTAEYTQSNLRSDNSAYALTWNYDFTEKTALYITKFRVGANGDMGGQGEFDNNNRGFYYGLTHAFNDRLSLEIVYKDQFLMSDRSRNSKWEVFLRNSF